VIRIGESRNLIEGSFLGSFLKRIERNEYKKSPHEFLIKREMSLLLPSGISLKSYSLVTSREASLDELTNRYIMINFDANNNRNNNNENRGSDIIFNDLVDTPAVLQSIDEG
jgi:hypothetical protein